MKIYISLRISLNPGVGPVPGKNLEFRQSGHLKTNSSCMPLSLLLQWFRNEYPVLTDAVTKSCNLLC